MDAEDVEVAAAELCGFVPLHPVRCPAFHTKLQVFFFPWMGPVPTQARYPSTKQSARKREKIPTQPVIASTRLFKTD